MKVKLSKLYTWSIVLEFIRYLVFSSEHTSAVHLSAARVLQAAVMLLLLAKMGHVKIPGIGDWRFKGLWFYFGLAMFSAFIGIGVGLYDTHEYQGEYIAARNILVRTINSPLVRPVFEYLILGYYIIYFSVLPVVIIKTKKDICYFFKIFFLFFNLALVLGCIDYAVRLLYNWNLISRYIFDTSDSGLRFHGILGEPRDAFSSLGLGMAMYHIKCYLFHEQANKYYYLIIVTCMFLAQSMSGLVGIVIFILLAYLLNIKKIIILIGTTYKRLMPVAMPVVIAIIFGGLIYYPDVLLIETRNDALESLSHLQLHFTITLAPEILYNVYHGSTPPGIMRSQISNIYPLFWIVQSLTEFNPLPFLFGGGLGAASAVNNIWGEFNALTNPNANIIRVLAETGMIGLTIYVAAFYIPVRNITSTLSGAQRNAFCLFTILIISLQLGHRTPSVFVYFGILMATFEVMRNAENINSQTEADD